MGRKRYTTQILIQILEACQGNGASKTAVVYASGLNFKTIVPYLNILDQYGLLDITNEPTALYRLTSKGIRALDCLKELDILIPGPSPKHDCKASMPFG